MDKTNPNDECGWTENEDGSWETDCGHSFEIIDGTPADNGFQFCVYCGRRLIGVPYLTECACGGQIILTSSLITTEQGVRDWLPGVKADPPILVNVDSCRSCGKVSIAIRDRDGRLLARRG